MIGIAFLLGIFIGMEIGKVVHRRDECKRKQAELDQRMEDYCDLNNGDQSSAAADIAAYADAKRWIR